MRSKITRVEPLSAAKVIGALYGVLGLLVMPVLVVPAFIGREIEPLAIATVVALPLLYAIAGFLGAGILCALYNLLAPRIGCVEIDLSSAEE